MRRFARAGIDYGLFDQGTPGLFRVAGPVWAVRALTGMADPKWPCPFGAPGDRLWVRERFSPYRVPGGCACSIADATYAVLVDGTHVDRDGEITPGLATYSEGAWDGVRWRPSIHMPRWASRIALEVTGVRVERLQAITEEDARAEGVDQGEGGRLYPSARAARALSYRAGFEHLWNAINGKRAPWASNPWVWVVDFRRVEGGGSATTADPIGPATGAEVERKEVAKWTKA